MSEKVKTVTKENLLGDILVRLGVITVEQLAEALPHCDSHQRNLLSVLAEMGFASEDKLLKAISVRQHVPYFTTFKGILDPSVAKLIPQKTARRLLVVPIRQTKQGLMLAMINPIDIQAIDTVATHAKMKVNPVLTTRRCLFETINKVYEEAETARPAPKTRGDGAVKEGEAPPPGAPGEKAAAIKIIPRGMDSTLARYNAEDTSVIEIVDGIIGEAVATRASDIHLEPTSNTMRMRMRVDGLLQNRRGFLRDLEPAIVARIKILANLDITEVRLPQDGHISVDYGGRAVDLRVSTLPTIYGEKVVIRVLDQASSKRELSHLGFPEEILRTFDRVIRAPMGLLLVTGPTGSGKTTTLYGALNAVNTEDKNIITLEDPVEYRLAGINQVETNHRIGLTFAAGLRSILRQDPNVILVGEIRDLETAEIAIQASITGHQVFSTLHTKDAVSTVARLLNMRVEPYLLSAALSGVLAQRLVRVLCEKCKRPQMPSKAEVALLGTPLKEPGPFFSPVGCETCLGLGYTGRLGIYEWLIINRELRALLNAGVSPDDLKEAAKAGGMKSLQEAGLDKVYSGVTSLAEVVRVTHEEEFELEPEKK